MLPEMSARKALEIVRKGDPRMRPHAPPSVDMAEYARALAILAALVEESELWDTEGPLSKDWANAVEKRRKLERGEES